MSEARDDMEWTLRAAQKAAEAARAARAMAEAQTQPAAAETSPVPAKAPLSPVEAPPQPLGSEEPPLEEEYGPPPPPAPPAPTAPNAPPLPVPPPPPVPGVDLLEEGITVGSGGPALPPMAKNPVTGELEVDPGARVYYDDQGRRITDSQLIEEMKRDEDAQLGRRPYLPLEDMRDPNLSGVIGLPPRGLSDQIGTIPPTPAIDMGVFGGYSREQIERALIADQDLDTALWHSRDLRWTLDHVLGLKGVTDSDVAYMMRAAEGIEPDLETQARNLSVFLKKLSGKDIPVEQARQILLTSPLALNNLKFQTILNAKLENGHYAFPFVRAWVTRSEHAMAASRNDIERLARIEAALIGNYASSSQAMLHSFGRGIYGTARGTIIGVADLGVKIGHSIQRFFWDSPMEQIELERDIARDRRDLESLHTRLLPAWPRPVQLGFAHDVISTFPQAIGQLLSGLYLGPIGASIVIGSQIMAGDVDEFIAKGATWDDALNAAAADAIIQAPMEWFGFQRWMRPFRGLVGGARHLVIPKVAWQWGSGVVVESGTEWAQSFPAAIANLFIDARAQPEGKQWEYFKEHFWDRVDRGIAEGWYDAKVMAPIAMIMRGGRLGYDYDRALANRKLMDLYESVGAEAMQTELRKRDPKAFADFMAVPADFAKNGTIHMSIDDWEAGYEGFAQDERRDARALQIEDQIVRAKAPDVRGDLEISYPLWVAHMIDTPAEGRLRQSIRFTADSFTQAEVLQQREKWEEVLKVHADLLKATEGGDLPPLSAGAMEMRQELVVNGEMTAAAADKIVRLGEAYARVLESETKESVEGFWKRWNIKIKQEGADFDKLASEAVGDRIAKAILAADDANSDVFGQVHGFALWMDDRSAWLRKQGRAEAEIAEDLRRLRKQLAIISALGPVKIEKFPVSAMKNFKGKQFMGPIRTNVDHIYKISFDPSTMCPKRLGIGYTEEYVRSRLRAAGRADAALTVQERMALVAMLREAGKEHPCLYCYVEAPRAKAIEMGKETLGAIFGTAPVKKSWSKTTKRNVRAAQEEVRRLGLKLSAIDFEDYINASIVYTPASAARRDKTPAIANALWGALYAAKAKRVELYEEYSGEFLTRVTDKKIAELNGYAGLRFLSSSDFMPDHVVDFVQAIWDLASRHAKAHAYTKIPLFAELFGRTGMKIQCSVFAREGQDGKIVADVEGMDWADAKRLRRKYGHVGTVLVATTPRIAAWGLQQDWIDYIIPYHASGLQRTFFERAAWINFTSTQNETHLTKKDKDSDDDRPKVQKIRMHELGVTNGTDGDSRAANERITRNYLRLCLERQIMPVFPQMMFKELVEEAANDPKFVPVADEDAADALARHLKSVKKREDDRKKRGRERWRAMVKAGRIKWSEIDMQFGKVKKDYARTDTPFAAVRPEFDNKLLERVINEFAEGKHAKYEADTEIGDKLFDLIESGDPTRIGSDLVARVYGIGDRAPDADNRFEQAAFGGHPARRAFYSSLERKLEEMPFKVMPASDVLNMLRKTKGVKAEELEWSRAAFMLEQMARENPKAKITKDELLEIVRDNLAGIVPIISVHEEEENALDREVLLEYVREKLQRRWEFSDKLHWFEYAGMYDLAAKREWDSLPEAEKKKYPTVDAYANELESQNEPEKHFSEEEIKGQFELWWEEEWRNEFHEAMQDERELEASGALKATVAKFDQYARPYGKNYREFLFMLPWLDYEKRGHWEEHGVFLHMRTQDRDPMPGWGRSTFLNIVEIQSDLHQQGRETGYESEVKLEDLVYEHLPLWEATHGELKYHAAARDIEQAKRRISMKSMLLQDEAGAEYLSQFKFVRTGGHVHEIHNKAKMIAGEPVTVTSRMGFGGKPLAPEDAEELRVNAYRELREGRAPDAPWKKSEAWALLAFKHALLEAVSAGQSHVGWDSGTTQSMRWGGGTDERRAKGFAFFYDEMLPKVVTEYTRKVLGEPNATPVRSIHNDENWLLEITPQMAEAVTAGQTWFQSGDEEARPPRGYIEFGVDRQTVITLMRNHDPSTVLHEFGHIFLRDLQGHVKQGFASQRMVDDLAALEEFAGVSEGKPWSKDATEKVTRAFERYLREGVAPTKELKGPFARFREWLVAIYRHIESYAEITDEVRGVFDRMLGVERGAREEAETARTALTDFATALDVDGDEAAALDEAGRKDLDERRARKVARVLDAYFDAHGGRKALAAQAKAEVEALPIYQAIKALAQGGGLNLDELAEMFGRERIDALRARHEGIIRKGGGVSMDLLIEMLDKPGDEEALAALEQAERMGTAVKQRYRELFAEKEAAFRRELFGESDIPVDEEMANEARLDLLALQHAMIEKRRAQHVTARKQRIATQALKDQARRDVARQPVRDAVQYHRWLHASQRFGKKALEAAKKGKWDEASEMKRLEAYNLAMAHASIQMREQLGKITKRLKRFATAKNIEEEWQVYIRDLLHRWGLISSGPAPAVPFEKWIEAQGNEGPTAIAGDLPDFLKVPGTHDYRDLTWNQLEEFKEAMTWLAHVGSDLLTAIKVLDARTIEAAGERLAVPMHQLKPRSKIYEDAWFRRSREKLRKLLEEAMQIQLRFAEADGYLNFGPGRRLGPNERFLWGALTDATTAEWETWRGLEPEMKQISTALLHLTRRLDKRFGSRNGYYTEVQVGVPLTNLDAVRQDMERLGRRRWTAERIVSFAFQLGNEGNEKALREGYGYSDEEIERMKRLLTKEEWQSVQKIFDLINRFYEPMAKAHKRLHGVTPPKVAAKPITVTYEDGSTITIPGGYYPLIFDHQLNERAGQFVEQDLMKNSEQAIYHRAGVKKGFTHQRTGGTLPPLLTTGVLHQHLRDVVHYIHFAERLRDIDKITRTPEWRNAFSEAFGRDAYLQIRPALSRIARPVKTSRTSFESSLDAARATYSVLALWGNFNSMLVQPVAVIGAIPELGAGSPAKGVYWIGQAFKRLGKNPLKWVQQINELSPYMRQRMHAFDREIADAVARHAKTHGWARIRLANRDLTLKDVQDAGMTLYGWADATAVYPVWMAAYMRATNMMTEGSHDLSTDADCIAYADNLVRQVMPGAQSIDLSAIQGGDGWTKLFTAFLTPQFRFGSRMQAYYRGLLQGKISFPQYAVHVTAEIGAMPAAWLTLASLLATGEPPEWWEYVLAVVAWPVSWVPLIGQVVSAQTNRPSINIPATQFVERFGRFWSGATAAAIAALEGRPATRGLKQAAAGAVGMADFLVGLPISTKADIFAKGLEGMQRGQHENPFLLFIRQRKKERRP